MRPTFDLTFIMLAVAAGAYTLLAIWAVRGPQEPATRAGRARVIFLLATCITIGWAALGAADRLVSSFLPSHLAALLDSGRQLLWCLLLLTLLQTVEVVVFGKGAR